MTTSFKELGLSEPLLEALAHLGYERPTPIQVETIPALLQGLDVIGQAQTGTGKTAAFGLPLLEYIDPELQEVQAIVLTPTRELCIQVTQALRAYGEKRGIDVVAVFGGAPIRDQIAYLKSGGQVVVGTVGRVMDLMSRHALMTDNARYVVLDEADEMLDLGFFEDVDKILARCPSGRQTALFSATMPPPIKKLAEQRMFDPITIKVKAATLTIDTVRQYHLEVTDKDKPDAVAKVLKAERPDQAIIFVRTKIGVDRLARRLGDAGLRVKTLHGDMSQGARDGVMIAFKSEREKLLVATDVAARGLDITGVTHVINYDVPNSPDIYVHRIGRTGRAERTGRAITLITPKQRSDLQAIERHANTEIKAWTPDAVNDTKGQAKKGESDAAPEPAAEVVDAPVADAPVAEAPVADEPQAADEGAPKRRRRIRRKRGEKPSEQSPEPDEQVAAAAPEPVVSQPDAMPGLVDAEAPEPDAEPEPDEQERQARRPRHTKPTPKDGPRAKLVIGAGKSQGLEPADLIGAIVDHSHLEGEDITRVRVLDRFSFAEVPQERAADVVDKVSGAEVRGVTLKLELAKR